MRIMVGCERGDGCYTLSVWSSEAKDSPRDVYTILSPDHFCGSCVLTTDTVEGVLLQHLFNLTQLDTYICAYCVLVSKMNHECLFMFLWSLCHCHSVTVILSCSRESVLTLSRNEVLTVAVTVLCGVEWSRVVDERTISSVQVG